MDGFSAKRPRIQSFAGTRDGESFRPKNGWTKRFSADGLRFPPLKSDREKDCWHKEPRNCERTELVAILIRSGRPGESAIDAGEKIARHYHERLADLPDAGRGELKTISHAVEVTAYCQIMAGIELGRRVAQVATDRKPTRILSSSEAIQFCETALARLMMDGKQEEFHIVTLDTKNQVIATHQITVGTLDASLVHPREVFRAAIKDAASSIILVHNHPSGDPTPSREDLAVTKRLEEAGETIGINVLDHIVLGAFQSISIREYRG